MKSLKIIVMIGCLLGLTVAGPLTPTAQAAPGELHWATQTTDGLSSESGYGIATDGDGNSLVAGSFYKYVTFGAGEANQTTLTSAGDGDIFVAKYDPSGALLWVKQAGGTDFDFGQSIATDSDGNSLVTGYFEGTATFGAGEANETSLTSAGRTDIFVAKYDSSGALLWATQAGGDNRDEGDGIATDGDGNSLVTGAFYNDATFGAGEANETTLTSAGNRDIFVAQYAPNGALLWVKQAGGTDYDHGLGIATDGAGNSLVTGGFSSDATFGPGEANETTLTSAGGYDIFMAQYDPSGALLWAKRAGGTSGAYGYGIATDGAGNSLVTGDFYGGTATFGAGEANETTLTSAGSSDIFVAQYAPNGALLWVKQAGGDNWDEGYDIATDGVGNSLVTGSFQETVTFGPGEANETTLTSAGSSDIFVAQYAPNGALLWVKQAGGDNWDEGYGIATDGAGNSLVTGTFEETATFGAGEANETTLTSGGAMEMFLARFEPQPGSLTVIKEANPEDGTDFAFSSDIPDGESFSLDDEPVQTDAVNQSITFADIPVGSYDISESVPSGWQLDDAACTGGSDSGSLSGETLTVALGAGEDVVCTFSNALQRPDLSVTKTHDTDGSIDALSTFTWTIAITNSGTAGATFSDGQVIFQDDLSPNGTYDAPTVGNLNNVTNPDNLTCSVAANVLTCVADGGEVTLEADSGFEVTLPTTAVNGPTIDNPVENGVCASDPADVIAEADDTNNDCAANSVEVIGRWVSFTKVVSGGTAEPEDFTLNIGSLLHDVPFGDIFLPDGTHIITENGPDGYVPVSTDDFNCSLEGGPIVLRIGAGYDFSQCEITNEALPGSLTIVKDANPADGTDFAFTSDIPANGAGTINTVAGDGTYGFGGDGGPATAAHLHKPTSVAVDSAGNLWIADYENHRIRKVDAGTGIISTVAGDGTAGFSGDGGPATAAQLNAPAGVAVDSAGNLWIADIFNHRIRKVDAGTGIISTVAGDGTAGFGGDGGPATAAQLNYPAGMAIDSAGNLWIADEENHRIRRVDVNTGIIDTVAGDGTAGFGGDGGPATATQLNSPTGVAVDSAGNLWIADYGNHRIRQVDAGTGYISTVAGDDTAGFGGDGGPATAALLNAPVGVAVDNTGNLWIADAENHRIRQVDAGTGIISTVAGDGTRSFGGDGGPATAANLNFPGGVAVDSAGNLWIADTYNHRIRKVAALLTSFSLDDEPVQTDTVNQSITFADIPAGSYAVTETLPAGWQLDAAACTGGSDSGSLSGETLSVALGAGEDVVCTFTNTLDVVVVTPTPEPGVVPEPSTIVLFGVGLLGLLSLTRRSRNKKS